MSVFVYWWRLNLVLTYIPNILILSRRGQHYAKLIFYLSNRPQVSMGYKLMNHAGCWWNTRRICKPRAASEWFTNYSEDARFFHRFTGTITHSWLTNQSARIITKISQSYFTLSVQHSIRFGPGTVLNDQTITVEDFLVVLWHTSLTELQSWRNVLGTLDKLLVGTSSELLAWSLQCFSIQWSWLSFSIISLIRNKLARDPTERISALATSSQGLFGPRPFLHRHRALRSVRT